MGTDSVRKLLESGLVWLAENAEAGHSSRQSSDLTGTSITGTSIKGPSIAFGLKAIDTELPAAGLACGGLHEFFYGSASYNRASYNRGKNGKSGSVDEAKDFASDFFIPATLPSILAAHGWAPDKSRYLIWIGKSCWPTPFLLERIAGAEILKHSLFADPPDMKLKLWTMETALRSQGVCAVIADCDRLRFTLSRRLALASEAGGTTGLLLRKPADKNTPSSALTRWQISPVPSPSSYPRWELELLKCKGRQPSTSWVVEMKDEEAISLHIPSDVVDRSAQGSRRVAA